MKRTTFTKHIYKVGNKYSIDKSINNKRKHFGVFENLNEAMEYRDKLIANNWEPLPETPANKNKRLIKEYFMRVSRHGKRYHVKNNKDDYIGTTKIIEEALYFRDIYCTFPKDKVPPMNTVDLITDNYYYKYGLDYPLPERLILPQENSKYGKGVIVKKGETSFHIYHGKKGDGHQYYICACPTIEMAEYVKSEMNKVDWDRDELQRILDNYPRYYTYLLFFYQYVNRDWYNEGSWIIIVPTDHVPEGKSFVYYGGYSNIEDALFERDFLMEHDWDYNLLVEAINDNDNPYYDMTLPPYPTRKVRNISRRNYHEKELTLVYECLKENPDMSQGKVCEMLNIGEVTLRNWLRKFWNSNWKEFKQLTLDGFNPLEVLEKTEQIIQPDLSTAKPNNYNGYVHCMKNGRFNVSKGGEYYGTYPTEKLARKIAKDLMNCDFDKSKLKSIQAKHGYTSPIMSKKWVYKHGRKWAVRRKDKDRKMITYGAYYDKRIACLVRDMFLMYGWKLENMGWIEDIAIWTINLIDSLSLTLFSRTSFEDIDYLGYIEEPHDELYLYPKGKKYQVRKRVNGKYINFGTYSKKKAKRIVEFLQDNNWNEELLNVMLKMGEI